MAAIPHPRNHALHLRVGALGAGCCIVRNGKEKTREPSEERSPLFMLSTLKVEKMNAEYWAILGVAFVAALVAFERVLERIPPIAEKAVAAVRSIRAVADEFKRKRE